MERKPRADDCRVITDQLWPSGHRSTWGYDEAGSMPAPNSPSPNLSPACNHHHLHHPC